MSCRTLVSGLLLILGADIAQASLPITRAKLLSLKTNQMIKGTALAGKPVVVDFWATWCESCRKNLSMMERMYRNSNPNAEFLFVSVDEEGPDALRSFFEIPDIKRSLAWIKPRAYWDKDQTLSASMVKNGIPYLAAYDSKGALLFEHSGTLEERDLKKLGKLIKSEK